MGRAAHSACCALQQILCHAAVLDKGISRHVQRGDAALLVHAPLTDAGDGTAALTPKLGRHQDGAGSGAVALD